MTPKDSFVGRGFLARIFGQKPEAPYNSVHSIVKLPLFSVEYKIETDGIPVRVGHRMKTEGARHTILKINVAPYSDVIEICGGDIDENGLISASDAQVTVNGYKIERYTDNPIDLKAHGGMALNRAYQERSRDQGMRPL